MKKFLGNKLPNREYNDNIQNSLKTIGNFKLDWTIIDGLKLSSVFGSSTSTITEVCTIPVRHWPGCWTASLSESPAGRTPPISTGQTPTNWTSPRSSEGAP